VTLNGRSPARLHAPGLPQDAIRRRARCGPGEAFPPADGYGRVLFGSGWEGPSEPVDALEQARLVPPLLMPSRLEKLIELGREPHHGDVRLATVVGGLPSALPLYVSAFGSTQVAAASLGVAVARQAARLGIPLVIGENVAPMTGSGRLAEGGLLARVRAYAGELDEGPGGVVVQQSTEDADAEVWNLVYSDLTVQPLLDSGRLAFELKLGQGAKPGLGGMTLLDPAAAARVAGQYRTEPVAGTDRVLRSSCPGTVTEEILRQQVRLMRNNFPRARVWVKLFGGRDVAEAAQVAWRAGADAVTVDGAEAGTGWAPRPFLDRVGLPLAECLRRLGPHVEGRCLLASGRFWEGGRAAVALALGATAVGLGRAALLAADEDPEDGLVRFVGCLEFELRLLVSALGKYTARSLDPGDVWFPGA
jgi:hypothetical protein